MHRRNLPASIVALALAASCGGSPPARTTSSERHEASLDDLKTYIHRSWDILTRTHRDLPAAASDPMVPSPDGKFVVYFPREAPMATLTAKLMTELDPGERGTLEFARLPEKPTELRKHGLLYVPFPYVVPGGRFNAVYGWDSYFILIGVIHDGRRELARNIVDNHLYEVEHYGAVLNANRTYFLTRSQPPFLSRMVLELDDAYPDRNWLERAAPIVQRFYEFWLREPHLTPATGLSRYYDLGAGPSAEVYSERDARGLTHYERAIEYYRTHEVDAYDESRFFDAATGRLTDLFYVGDRSMRESGFDPSNRFGPLGVAVIDYNPVCLNTLLYVMEIDLAELARRLGKDADRARWLARAEARRELVRELLWDESAKMFLDYDVTRRTRRNYAYLTTFYPLWAGLATNEQAAHVASTLPTFERSGGLMTSPYTTGNQWDAPFGWAPLHLIAVEGLRRYGFEAAARRVTRRFVATVLREFDRRGAIFEKYDVLERNAISGRKVRFGYTTNEVGFGWTNGVVLRLLDRLPQRARDTP